jgi:hypothetical protein
MMGTELLPETLVIFGLLRGLRAREYFINTIIIFGFHKKGRNSQNVGDCRFLKKGWLHGIN